MAELHARQAIEKLNRLTNDLRVFATHAKTLAALSGTIDGRTLLEEGDRMLKKLHASRMDFQNVESSLPSISRSLPSQSSVKGGFPPAAQWGSQLRASTKQFAEVARDVEKELRKLYSKAFTTMTDPRRTSDEVSSITDVLLNLIEVLSAAIEKGKKFPT